MNSLTEQLQDLAGNAREADAVATAARDRDLALLSRHRQRLREVRSRATDEGASQFGPEDGMLRFRWHQLRERVREQLAELRARAERPSVPDDLSAIEARADRTESDATDAVEFAILVLGGALEAVVEAALARAEADDLDVPDSSSAHPDGPSEGSVGHPST